MNCLQGGCNEKHRCIAVCAEHRVERPRGSGRWRQDSGKTTGGLQERPDQPRLQEEVIGRYPLGPKSAIRAISFQFSGTKEKASSCGGAFFHAARASESKVLEELLRRANHRVGSPRLRVAAVEIPVAHRHSLHACSTARVDVAAIITDIDAS